MILFFFLVLTVSFVVCSSDVEKSGSCSSKNSQGNSKADLASLISSENFPLLPSYMRNENFLLLPSYMKNEMMKTEECNHDVQPSASYLSSSTKNATKIIKNDKTQHKELQKRKRQDKDLADTDTEVVERPRKRLKPRPMNIKSHISSESYNGPGELVARSMPRKPNVDWQNIYFYIDDTAAHQILANHFMIFYKERGMFGCHRCYVTGRSFEASRILAMEKHELSHHKNLSLYQCRLCKNVKESSIASIYRHMKTHSVSEVVEFLKGLKIVLNPQEEANLSQKFFIDQPATDEKIRLKKEAPLTSSNTSSQTKISSENNGFPLLANRKPIVLSITLKQTLQNNAMDSKNQGSVNHQTENISIQLNNSVKNPLISNHHISKGMKSAVLPNEGKQSREIIGRLSPNAIRSQVIPSPEPVSPRCTEKPCTKMDRNDAVDLRYRGFAATYLESSGKNPSIRSPIIHGTTSIAANNDSVYTPVSDPFGSALDDFGTRNWVRINDLQEGYWSRIDNLEEKD